MVDLIIPSLQQANDSQSWGRKGAELSERPHIIGKLLQYAFLFFHIPGGSALQYELMSYSE